MNSVELVKIERNISYYTVDGQNVTMIGNSAKCYCVKNSKLGCIHTAVLKSYTGNSAYLTDREHALLNPAPKAKLPKLSMVNSDGPYIVSDGQDQFTVTSSTHYDQQYGSMYFKMSCSCGSANCRHINFAKKHINQDIDMDAADGYERREW